MARRFFTTKNPSVVIDAERFDPLVKPWPAGVVVSAHTSGVVDTINADPGVVADPAVVPTTYSIGGGLSTPGHAVAPGDWIVVDASTGERRPIAAAVFDATYTSLDVLEDDPLALEKFLRRVPKPVLTVGVSATRISLRLTSIDQSEVLEGFVDGNTFTVTPAPRTTNI